MRFGIVILLLVILTACGGVGSKSPAAVSNNNFAGSGSPPGSAVVVNTTAGQTDAGVDITVPAPAASPAANAQFLGLGTSASSTGDVIHQGQTATVLLFGTGLSGNMQVRISGPGDIRVSNVRPATSTSQTPGLQFDAAVSSGAALGGRTVLLISPQGDMTAFTGGLEVVP